MPVARPRNKLLLNKLKKTSPSMANVFGFFAGDDDPASAATDLVGGVSMALNRGSKMFVKLLSKHGLKEKTAKSIAQYFEQMTRNSKETSDKMRKLGRHSEGTTADLANAPQASGEFFVSSGKSGAETRAFRKARKAMLDDGLDDGKIGNVKEFWDKIQVEASK